MSNQYLKLRRSAVPGKIPETSSLDFGEIALNTYDGLLFIKKSGSVGGEQIVTIGDTTSNFTGSFTGSFTGFLFGSASYALTASYALNAGGASGWSYQIATGSVTASVNVGYDGIFLIKSSSYSLFEISGSSEANIYSDLLIIKNFTTKQPVLTVSESIVKFATHSVDPSGNTDAGAIWFTSNSMFVGLE